MFDIAWTELLVVAVIAIIVVGPKELPSMLRAFGKTFGQVRRTAREFQSTFNDALREAEREARLDDVRKNLDEVRHMNPAKDLSKSLNETRKAMSETVTDKPKADGETTGVDKASGEKTGSDKAGGEKTGAEASGSAGVVPLKPSREEPEPVAEEDARKVAGADRR